MSKKKRSFYAKVWKNTWNSFDGWCKKVEGKGRFPEWDEQQVKIERIFFNEVKKLLTKS